MGFSQRNPVAGMEIPFFSSLCIVESLSGALHEQQTKTKKASALYYITYSILYEGIFVFIAYCTYSSYHAALACIELLTEKHAHGHGVVLASAIKR